METFFKFATETEIEAVLDDREDEEENETEEETETQWAKIVDEIIHKQ